MKALTKTNLSIVGGLAVIVVSTIVHGRWSERWNTHEELKVMADRLNDVSLQAGEWQGENVTGPEISVLKVAGAVGSLSRLYRDTQNNVISVFMVCGRPNDIYIHTPEKCYPAAGFEMVGDPIRERIETPVGMVEFASATFIKSEQAGTQAMRVYWSYGRDGNWQTPTNIKWTFGGAWGLYKIYVVEPVNGDDSLTDRNPATAFIRAAVPELNHALFADLPANALETGKTADPFAAANAEQ